jgi:hypothetical protein
MFALPTGSSPVRKTSACLVHVAAAAMLAALGGCASTPADSSAHVSANALRVAQSTQVTDVEDDGLPAQTPPAVRPGQATDDPSEPYSRNYGGANPSASAAPLLPGPIDDHAPKQQLPKDLPPAFRQKLLAALAEDD